MSDIDKFVKEELNKKVSNKKIFFGKVSDEIAQIVKKDLGINIQNYNISLKDIW